MLGVVVFQNCINLDMCFEHLCMVSCSLNRCGKNSFVRKHEFLSVFSIFIEFVQYKEESAHLVGKYSMLM